MRYAIIENGGKQYKVFEGANIDVDLISAEVGTEIDLNNVLLVADGEKIKVGTPLVKGAHVKASIEAHVKGPKLTIFKYRPKQRYRVKTGHRQKYTRLQIGKVLLRGKEKKTAEEGNDGS
jgi:large subunit ribosomal protein L21